MADIWMDVDTAVTVPVNIAPIVDSTNGNTIDETIAYNESGMDLNWNFVTTAGVITQTNVVPDNGGTADYEWNHVGNGMYKIEIPASGGASANNNAEGFGWFSGKADAILPFRGPTIGFRSAVVNDALVDSNTFVTAQDLGILVDSTLGTPTNQTTFPLQTGDVTANSEFVGSIVQIEDASTGEFHVSWITSSTASTDTVVINSAPNFTAVSGDLIRIYAQEHPQYALATYSAATSSSITTTQDKMLAYFQLALRNDAAINTDRATELGEINTNEGTGAGDYDNQTEALEQLQSDISVVDGIVDNILVDTGTTIPATLGTPVADIATDIATVDTVVDAILVDTADMQPKLGSPAGASISADIAAVKTDTAAIVLDTDELQGDWVNGGRLDLLLDGVKAKTDQMSFGVTNELNVNVESMNATTLLGTGVAGDLWRGS